MSVWKWKLWFAWQEQEHEQWLAQQSRTGLHLRQTYAGGLLHRFVSGPPADVVYRWDCPPLRDGDYRQLFQDAGWRPVGSAVGWTCWAKPVAAGPAAEIFTDRASRERKYRKVMLSLLAPLLLTMLMLLTTPTFWQDLAGGARLPPVTAVLLNAALAANLLCLYGAGRLWQRIRQMRTGG